MPPSGCGAEPDKRALQHCCPAWYSARISWRAGISMQYRGHAPHSQATRACCERHGLLGHRRAPCCRSGTRPLTTYCQHLIKEDDRRSEPAGNTGTNTRWNQPRPRYTHRGIMTGRMPPHLPRHLPDPLSSRGLPPTTHACRATGSPTPKTRESASCRRGPPQEMGRLPLQCSGICCAPCRPWLAAWCVSGRIGPGRSADVGSILRRSMAKNR